MSLSVAALQAAVARDSDAAWLALVTLKDPNTLQVLTDSEGKSMRFVMNNEDVVSNSNTYYGMFMDVILVSQEEQRRPSARLRLGAVTRELQRGLEELQEPPVVDIEYVLSTALDTVVVSNMNMRIRNISYNARLAEAQLEGPNYFDELLPRVLMTDKTLPSLF